MFEVRMYKTPNVLQNTRFKFFKHHKTIRGINTLHGCVCVKVQWKYLQKINLKIDKQFLCKEKFVFVLKQWRNNGEATNDPCAINEKKCM